MLLHNESFNDTGPENAKFNIYVVTYKFRCTTVNYYNNKLYL